MDAITEGSPINDSGKQPAAMRRLLGRTAKDWWPESLSIEILHQKGVSGNPMGDDYDYRSEFLTLTTTS
jgi:catalase-peroxidase